MTGRWVEDELRGIDDDFRQDKMNAFGMNEDVVAEHVEELVTFASTLLLTSSRNATAAAGAKPKCEEFMCTDMSDAKFDEMATEFKNKQKHIEEMTSLMTALSQKVSTINECVNACDIDDD